MQQKFLVLNITNHRNCQHNNENKCWIRTSFKNHTDNTNITNKKN